MAQIQSVDNESIKYNQAKTWQIGLFALNNTATNIYMVIMGFVTYYATGIAGLLVVAVSTVLTAMRIFDGITDPLIGYLIDKTETKFGKFRPFMILGNAILAIMTLIIFNTTHKVPENMRLVYFIIMYAIYIIGYTFQTACTKAGQTVLTNDPDQRPIFSMFDAIYNTVLFIGMQIIVASVLVPKYGGFTMGLFRELTLGGIIVSAIFTILAIIGIKEKDVKENFGLGDSGTEVKFKDYWPVIKENRAIQMLIIAASTDKLAATVKQHSAVIVILYGILIGNYELSGTIPLITIIPTLIIVFIGINQARKLGQKRALVVSTWACIIVSSLLFIFLRVADLTTISLSSINFTTILFIILLSIQGGASGVAGNIVIPMIADCSDYETYRTGRYIPGMMGTVFSFVDKLISSLSSSIVGFSLAAIGYKTEFPQVGEASTPQLFWMTMFLFIGIPILGWIASIIAMKFYPLDNEKMAEVQSKIDSIKNNPKATI